VALRLVRDELRRVSRHKFLVIVCSGFAPAFAPCDRTTRGFHTTFDAQGEAVKCNGQSGCCAAAVGERNRSVRSGPDRKDRERPVTTKDYGLTGGFSWGLSEGASGFGLGGACGGG